MDVEIVATIIFSKKVHPVILLEDVYNVAEELISVDFQAGELTCLVDEQNRNDLKKIRGVEEVTFSIEGDF